MIFAIFFFGLVSQAGNADITISRESFLSKTQEGIIKAFCKNNSTVLNCSEISAVKCETESPKLVQDCSELVIFEIPPYLSQKSANKWGQIIVNCFGKKLGLMFPVNKNIEGCGK